MQNYYPHVNTKQDFPLLEREILEFWKEQGIFETSLDQSKASAEGNYVFYDGPPFANGLPHFGHLLTGYVKDLIPRYQTMQGKYVARRFGWDCHGLPAEMDAQKHLGINGRKEILAYGIEAFNDFCKTAIMKYTAEWEAYVNRQARWVDFEHSYKTMDLGFMESVMWAFAELWKKGYIYEGNKVMPYSWALETPLSNFETRLDNAYRNRQDPAITVAFDIITSDPNDLPLKALVWTTTPWSLPANLAIAVNPALEYGVYEKYSCRFLLGKTAFERYSDLLEGAKLVASYYGRDVLHWQYRPIFPYFSETPSAFQIFDGDFVTGEDGTGLVHISPGFGEDDHRLCSKYGIEPLCPVDSRARFTSEVPEYQGMQVFEANKPIIAYLKKNGVLFKQQTIDHNYPHCWRTDTPLIYKVQRSWYVNVTAFKDRLVELNQQINWVPGHVKNGSFGNWLEGAKDWSISRNRFFGTPIPVWKSDDPRYPRVDVYGSIEALSADFGVQPTDLHKQYIDSLTRPNPDDPTGESTMRRIDDVFDCWFESGSMPFAQLHYPFENREIFKANFPADFVVEYVAQTRGWFYTMMVMSVALFDKPPFKNAICHGVINDEDGEKLSKSKRNYPDPLDVFEEHGSDALRWYLMRSPILRGGDLQIDKEGKGISEAVRNVIIPLWNAYAFFCLYANADSVKAVLLKKKPTNVLDKYIMAAMRELVEKITQALDDYNIPGACADIEQFTDVLNNWYIRRSRERFWGTEKSDDKTQAYNTLYTVLQTISRLAAPFLPFLTESIFRGLRAGESVHLAQWPQKDEFPADPELVKDMETVIDICSSVLSLRKAQHIRVRQPLAAVTVYLPASGGVARYLDLIASEVNVKSILLNNILGDLGTREVVLNFKLLGPLLGSSFKEVVKAVKANNWVIDAAGDLQVNAITIDSTYFKLRFHPAPDVVGKSLEQVNGLVVVDTNITPELEEEGIARDFIRAVQHRRKGMGLAITARILVVARSSEVHKRALLKFDKLICEQTLTNNLLFQPCIQENGEEPSFEIIGDTVVLA